MIIHTNPLVITGTGDNQVYLLAMSYQVVWFKRDLRLADHPALSQAVESARNLGQPLLPLYLFEPSLSQAEDFSQRHLHFILDSLHELNRELEARGSRLLWFREEAENILEYLYQHLGTFTLWSHQETGHDLSYQRDLRVQAWCRQRGVVWHQPRTFGVIRGLRNRDGWANHWEAQMSGPPLPAPESLPPFPPALSAVHRALPTQGDFSLFRIEGETIQPGGRSHALKCLTSFLSHRGIHYTRAMSSPITAPQACSRLSPHLTYGTLSVREAYHAAQRTMMDWLPARNSEAAFWRRSLRSFTSRLRWHCHFIQKLEDEPSIEFQNLMRACDGLREHAWCEEKFHAWKEGRTGFPMIDACMRYLRIHGWINFRMRAMLMSFASYHLWLHWRPTGIYLARLFTDYEPGIHWPQCQMQSGTTGINTLRIYSPTRQAMEHDPDGTFIRQWVPELARVPTPYIHAPEKMPPLEQAMCGFRPGIDYPTPIVEDSTAYREAQRRLRAIRAQPEAKVQARTIQLKHGSRRPVRRTRFQSPSSAKKTAAK